MDEGSTVVTFTKTNITRLRQRAQCVVSESFHNSENENNMNYKSSVRIKFLVFVLRRSLCWFSLNCVNK